jgi:adenylate cyclase
MMQADEAGTLTALKSRRTEILQPLISKHHGRVVKLMGDRLLVEFASAVDAVECAVQLQQAMESANADLPEDRRIRLRIGINLGDVMIEGGDLYGDGVNIAARIEALADPARVVVSRTVFSHVRGKVKVGFDDLGEQQLKNIAEPVRVYRLRADGDRVIARPALALPDKPSLAVLPFENMSGDPDQECFADGIVEEIITALSRFRGLFVISRGARCSAWLRRSSEERLAEGRSSPPRSATRSPARSRRLAQASGALSFILYVDVQRLAKLGRVIQFPPL